MIPGSSLPRLNEGPTRSPAIFPDEQWTQEAVITCQTGRLLGQRLVTSTVHFPHSTPIPTLPRAPATQRLGLAWGGRMFAGLPGWGLPLVTIAHPRPDRKSDRSEPSRHPLCEAWRGLQCFPCQTSSLLASSLPKLVLKESSRLLPPLHLGIRSCSILRPLLFPACLSSHPDS